MFQNADWMRSSYIAPCRGRDPRRTAWPAMPTDSSGEDFAPTQWVRFGSEADLTFQPSRRLLYPQERTWWRPGTTLATRCSFTRTPILYRVAATAFARCSCRHLEHAYRAMASTPRAAPGSGREKAGRSAPRRWHSRRVGLTCADEGFPSPMLTRLDHGTRK